MDHELVKAAATAIVGALTKAAVDPALAAGRQAWDWLKGKLAPHDAQTAVAVEADPAKPWVGGDVTGLLQRALHADPAAEAELRKLLQAHGGLTAVTQTANPQGDQNKIIQQSGPGNTARIF
jgi:hypothetical protein